MPDPTNPPAGTGPGLTLFLAGALALLVVAALVARRRRAWLWLTSFCVAACGTTVALAGRAPGWTALGVTTAAIATGVWWWARRARSASVVSRWGARSRRKAGVASAVDVARVASAQAMRRKATAVRPVYTAGKTRREMLFLPAAQVGIELCRVDGQLSYASSEDVVAIFGGPRTGKTQWLAGRIIDAPGAVLVTSTRTDLHDQTRALRARRGPVRVFNAAGLGGLESTVTFDPLSGCTNPTTAADRAADLLSAGAGGGGDREFWEGQARRVLAALLYAAAVGGLGMRDVLSWVATPDTAGQEVISQLNRSGADAYSEDAVQFLGTNDRTRSSITSTIMPALGWLSNPEAAAAAEPGRSLDVAELLDTDGTVYLLGAEESQTAPLVTALTGHIAREARRTAALRPGGRLDPPLTLALDEAALICPVPLHRWSADMGGRGVTIIAAFQSRAQLLDRYDDAQAAAFMTNCGARMVFGGGDLDDLTYWSNLAGDRDEPVVTTDDHGKVTSRTVRKVPVIAPAQFASLPAERVVLFRRGMPPAVGRVRMAWRRRDVRAHARSVTRAATHPDAGVARPDRESAPAGDGWAEVPRQPWGHDPQRSRPARDADSPARGGR